MTDAPGQEIGLSLRQLSKRFGPVVALDSLDLDLYRGEIHGVLGENGSGKSTLVKLLTGFHSPEPGAVCEIGGEEVSLPIRRPELQGIAVIHQDLGLVESLTVMENVGIGLRYDKRSFELCSWRSERRACRTLLREFDLDVDPRMRVSDLSPAERAVVAVARAVRLLRKQERVHAFLLDEPTAYMPVAEADKVLAVMRNVAKLGAAVVFVSHRLDEVLGVTNRITVLRDGRKVGTVETPSATREQLRPDDAGERRGRRREGRAPAAPVHRTRARSRAQGRGSLRTSWPGT